MTNMIQLELNCILLKMKIIIANIYFGKKNLERNFVSHVDFSSNTHQASHLARNMLELGRPQCYSMFGPKTAHMQLGKEASGVHNLLDSIIRFIEK